MRLSAGALRAGLLTGLLALAACGQPGNVGGNPTNLVPGLSAEYQGVGENQWQRVARVDRNIAFDWGRLTPVEGMFPGEFKATWKGFLVAPETGTFKVTLEGSGAVALSLAGQETSAFGKALVLSLQKGQAYPFQLNYQRVKPDDSAVILRWHMPGQVSVGEGKVVPASAFKTEPASVARVQSPTTQAVPADINLLRNPSFEEGTGLWVRYSGNRNLVAGRNNSGSALEIGNAAWIQQDLPSTLVQPGLTYTLTGWGKGSTSKPGEAPVCYAALAYGETSDKRQVLLFDSSSFVQKTVRFTLPPDATYLAVYLNSPDASVSCQFDDLSVTATDPNANQPAPPAATVQSPIVNNTFEYGLQGWNIFGVAVASAAEKTLTIAPYTWAQQNLNVALLEVGKKYKLSARIVRRGPLSNTPVCRVGLSGGPRDGSTQTLATLQTASNAGADLEQIFTLPADLTWAALYITTGDQSCVVRQLTLSRQPSQTNLSWQEQPLPSGVQSGHLIQDGVGRLWLLDGQRLYRRDGNIFVQLPSPYSPLSNQTAAVRANSVSFDETNNPIVALEVSTTSAGRVTGLVSRVVRWTGSGWENIGTSVGGSVDAIATPPVFAPSFTDTAWYEGQLYAVLDNNQVGMPSRMVQVVRWDGSGWVSQTAFGTAMPLEYNLYISGGNLWLYNYAGGFARFMVKTPLGLTMIKAVGEDFRTGYPKFLGYAVTSDDKVLVHLQQPAQTTVGYIDQPPLATTIPTAQPGISLYEDQPVIVSGTGSSQTWNFWDGSSWVELPKTPTGTGLGQLVSRRGGETFVLSQASGVAKLYKLIAQ